jgi:hypothetical protein
VSTVAFAAGCRGVKQWNGNTAGIVRASVLPKVVVIAAAMVVSLSGFIFIVANTARNRGSRLGSNGSYDGSLLHRCHRRHDPYRRSVPTVLISSVCLSLIVWRQANSKCCTLSVVNGVVVVG